MTVKKRLFPAAYFLLEEDSFRSLQYLFRILVNSNVWCYSMQCMRQLKVSETSPEQRSIRLRKTFCCHIWFYIRRVFTTFLIDIDRVVAQRMMDVPIIIAFLKILMSKCMQPSKSNSMRSPNLCTENFWFLRKHLFFILNWTKLNVRQSISRTNFEKLKEEHITWRSHSFPKKKEKNKFNAKL